MRRRISVSAARTLDREPRAAEVANALKVKESELPLLEEWRRTGYPRAGFRVWDISDIARHSSAGVKCSSFQRRLESRLSVFGASLDPGLRRDDGVLTGLG